MFPTEEELIKQIENLPDNELNELINDDWKMVVLFQDNTGIKEGLENIKKMEEDNAKIAQSNMDFKEILKFDLENFKSKNQKLRTAKNKYDELKGQIELKRNQRDPSNLASQLNWRIAELEKEISRKFERANPKEQELEKFLHEMTALKQQCHIVKIKQKKCGEILRDVPAGGGGVAASSAVASSLPPHMYNPGTAQPGGRASPAFRNTHASPYQSMYPPPRPAMHGASAYPPHPQYPPAGGAVSQPPLNSIPPHFPNNHVGGAIPSYPPYPPVQRPPGQHGAAPPRPPIGFNLPQFRQ